MGGFVVVDAAMGVEGPLFVPQEGVDDTEDVADCIREVFVDVEELLADKDCAKCDQSVESSDHTVFDKLHGAAVKLHCFDLSLSEFSGRVSRSILSIGSDQSKWTASTRRLIMKTAHVIWATSSGADVSETR